MGYGPTGGWPMMPFYPPPPPKPRGIGRLLFTLMLGLLLVGSFLLNLVLMAGGGSGSDEPTAVSQVIRKGDDKQRVAVIEVAGPIDGNTSARFARLIDHVEREQHVQALVIEIDSPGGTVTASDEIYERILRYKAGRKSAGKPAGVVISMRSMATSGGYYVACAGDYIFAEQTTLTGNIGVLMSRFNFSELMQKHGVAESTIVSTGADFKNIGSPFSPETEEGKAYLKGIVDDAFNRFKQVVTAGRGASISGKDIFNGKVFTASEAVRDGLVDKLGYPDDAYTYAATKVASLSNPKVMRYREPSPGLLGMLVGGTSANSTAAPPPSAQSFDLSSLARPETLDAWRTARLMYR
ncbi:signal peptide peptidase SppA [Humisphaera borealis]|uniref:Signal peptide peptidase SppA n=1 Tax=Humisphaera borealis TaxID=2807512 RepID=A0A7M2WVL1_9BACT|nr:signal peptide peptidase SppA [Humisphaera borealis]QOV89525.1 signal peptide peptidase SppA [Humisphaera borealis]